MLKDTVIDAGCPYNINNLDDLIYIKNNQPDFYIRTLESLKSYIKMTHFNEIMKTREKKNIVQEKAKKSAARIKKEFDYVTFVEKKGGSISATLELSRLCDDIIEALYVRRLSKTKKEMGLYNPKTGTYSVGDYVWTLINREVDRRVVGSGDENIETLNPTIYNKIEMTIRVRAPEISGSEFESATNYLCVGNGVVDLRTSKLLEYNSSYKLVERTSTMYDDDAPWYEQATGWKAALEAVFDGDQSKMDYFQKAMGYGITGETDVDAIFFLYGQGGTGKSTILDSIRIAVSNNDSNESGYIMPLKADLQAGKAKNGGARDGIARAKYARMLIVKELAENNEVSWDTLKEMCSTSSLVEARENYGRTQMLKLRSKLIFDTNHMPIAVNADDSITRRLKVIPFRHKFREDKNTNTFAQLKDEEMGILHWLIDGARRYYEEGLSDKNDPQFIKDEVRIYESDMDEFMLADWFASTGYIIASSVPRLPSNNWVKSAMLFIKYKTYAMSNGLSKTADQKAFVKYLKNKGAVNESETFPGETTKSKCFLNIQTSE
jgi:P4 family phage/plasmid primase-like protien